MKIADKLAKKQGSFWGEKPVTIAFLGDSVTHGCFELVKYPDGRIDTVYEYKNAYSTRVREMLNLLYPSAQINIINSGISGDSAAGGLNRINRDVLNYHPDLVVVSFGLNDSGNREAGLESYLNNLRQIFKITKAACIETVFLTQNYMAENVSHTLTDPDYANIAKFCAETQNSGILEKYFTEAKKVCEEEGVRVCDIYDSWDKMARAGVNVTELLANKINHPCREMHYYIAMKLVETFLS